MANNIFNVLDYGAVSDGGDSSAAFNAAFNALNNNPDGGVIYIPAGNYLIQNTIFGATNKAFEVRGEGSASQLVLNGGNMANGIVMQQNTANGALEIRDLQIYVTGATGLGNGSVLSVIGTLQGVAGLRIENIHIRMSDDSPVSNVVLVRNPSQGVIRDLNIDGYSSWGQSNTATGLYIDCVIQGANAIQLFNVNVFRTYYGIRCIGGQINQQYDMEGFQATGCSCVGVQYGLVMMGGWYQPPGYGWFGGHINAAQLCVQINTWSEFKVQGALLYLNSDGRNVGGTPQGFVLIQGSDDVQVKDNTCRFVNEETGAANTPGCYGVAATNSSNVLITGNFFDINETAGSTAVYSAGGNSNVRTAFNTARGVHAFLANSDGAARSIGEDLAI